MRIPFTNVASQKFSISINEIDYSFEVNYNTMYEFWTIDISSNNFKVIGIKLVAGIDILRAFPDAPFQLISNNISDPLRFDLEFFELEVI